MTMNSAPATVASRGNLQRATGYHRPWGHHRRRVRWHYGAGELAQNGSGSGHPQIIFQRQRYSPELAISVADGVRMYTINAAYQEGKEAVRGLIEVGKVADFQVLDRDIFAVAHEEIGASRVVMTMVGGNVVFQD